jgi:hypothetical protein
MAGDGGLNALSLLPENVLPQWQQKIAHRAETTRPLGPRLSAIFTSLESYIAFSESIL